MFLFAAALATATPAAGQAPAVAQQAQAPAPQQPPAAPLPQQQPAPLLPQQFEALQDGDGARGTRQRLQELLRQHPPAVGEVLMRDPSLLQREDYLAPYPVLVAFLRQHPEIARNPSYFLGSFEYQERDDRQEARSFTQEILETLFGTIAGLTAFGVFVWLVRTLVDYRRWVRASRVQTEVHMKLMDRMANNDELLAYIQTPAGRRFLESAPISVEGEARPGGAPFARIIWTVQAGVVLLALGLGFWWIKATSSTEVAEGFSIVAIIVVSLGIGFTVSAAVAYLISARLGLIASPRVDHA
jgi:hypothetical protein